MVHARLTMPRTAAPPPPPAPKPPKPRAKAKKRASRAKPAVAKPAPPPKPAPKPEPPQIESVAAVLAKKPRRRPAASMASDLARAQDRNRAVDMIIRGHSYVQVAEALRCSRNHAYVLVTQALDELRAETMHTADRMRDVHLQRLEMMTKKYLEKAMAGEARHGEVLLKVMERQASLLGADAPKRLAGADGGPIQVVISAAEGQF